MNKYLILLIVVLLLAIPVSADVVTIVNIPRTSDESDFKMDNLINAEINADPENTIHSINILPQASPSGDGTIQITFEDKSNTTYLGQITKNTWIIFTTYTLTQNLISGNYTIINSTKSGEVGLDSSFFISIKYNKDTGNNTFWIAKNSILPIFGDTTPAQALPSQHLRIQADIPFSIEAYVVNDGEMLLKEQQRAELNPILRYIAGIANVILPGWAYDGLMTILIFLNIILLLLGLIVLAVYSYPYLVFVWYLTLLNVYVSFKTETFSQFIVEWGKGIIGAIDFSIKFLFVVGNIVVALLRFLRQILQL